MALWQQVNHPEIFARSVIALQGPGLLSYLLQQRKSDNLTVPLLNTMEGLLSACQPAESLSKDILCNLVLNLDLWNPAPLDTQRQLLKLLHKLGQVAFPQLWPAANLVKERWRCFSNSD